ncbi:hypothetical protein B0A55_06102 [Friedmanniomyces simplex]|uniref:C2H2-type domain-containing protein n=1 Tax=Friedmanniomyces simplex TaxID=329884 RepID=A0A4U0XHB4_9PEZI|nr:hypothetical protein B0A55_06102 [Friedmanniomyces simplex]
MSDQTDRQQQQDCTMTDFVSLPPWGDFVNDIDWEDSINWEYWARAYDEARDGVIRMRDKLPAFTDLTLALTQLLKLLDLDPFSPKTLRSSLKRFRALSHSPRVWGSPATQRMASSTLHQLRGTPSDMAGCEKLQQPRPFIRSDKLTAHLKLCHRVLALFACPYEQCAGGLLGRDLMYVHLVKAHTADHSHSSKTARAMTNAIATDKPFCPRWECRKSLPLGKFEPHVLAPGKEDLLAMGDDLLALNYIVVINGDSDLAEGSVVEPHQDPASCDRMTLKVLCPVCKSILDSREAFRNHFAQHHVVAAEHEEHFIAWRETASAFDRWSPYEQFVPYKPWSLWSDFHIRCTYCNHAVHPVRINIAIGKVQHHMSMLADPEQLRPYRMQILKLLPEFIRHPIWDDLGKPLQQFHDGGLANA